MLRRIQILSLCLIAIVAAVPAAGPANTTGINARIEQNGREAVDPLYLWQNPGDIRSRDLLYGSGGKEHQPHGPFTFLKEDMDGTNPKFDVRDQDGVKWKVKLGEEARPETAATRLVWVVGYFTNEDYFLPTIQVQNMPPRLHRGQSQVAPGGIVHNVRLKRHLKGQEKLGIWRWHEGPFDGTRELNGLRVMMALMNNWDLKDENNAAYKQPPDRKGPNQIYMVSDLGASFGTTGRSWTRAMSKGNLKAYRNSTFIDKVGPEYVDFKVPTRPALIFVVNPREFSSRLHLRWLGKDIPRSHGLWMGQLLAQLSPGQIRDAFRTAGYSPQEVEEFATVVESRIAELNKL